MGSFQPTISVPVLYNNTGEFLNGRLYSIESNSTVYGVSEKQNGTYISGQKNVPIMVDTLHVKSPSFGDLFLDLTMSEYQALVGAVTDAVPDEQEALDDIPL